MEDENKKEETAGTEGQDSSAGEETTDTETDV